MILVDPPKADVIAVPVEDVIKTDDAVPQDTAEDMSVEEAVTEEAQAPASTVVITEDKTVEAEDAVVPNDVSSSQLQTPAKMAPVTPAKLKVCCMACIFTVMIEFR